jgi:hypothetical protein
MHTHLAFGRMAPSPEMRQKGKERKGKERNGKERKGKERKGKERKGKERKVVTKASPAIRGGY